MTDNNHYLRDKSDTFQYIMKDVYTGLHINTNTNIIYGVNQSEFKISDTVKFISNNGAYSAYKAMLHAMGYKNYKLLDGDDYQLGATGVVIGIKLHESYNEVIYGIKFNNHKDCIGVISENSLKLVKNGDYIRNFEFEDWFELWVQSIKKATR